MSKTLVVVSMLHEDAAPNSATRLFHAVPVLAWTLRRTEQASALKAIEVLCWDDQFDVVRAVAGARAYALGPRRAIPTLDAVSASRRWSDGWRGGLLGTCEFDRGFDAAVTLARLDATRAENVLLVDPAAALVDATLLTDLVDRLAEAKSEYAFSQAAPGLGGLALTRDLVARLAGAQTHLGRFLTFLPDQVMRDPISSSACVLVEAEVSRSTRRFTIDSDRQSQDVSAALAPLNGQLVCGRADAIVRQGAADRRGSFPRDVTLELTTRRLSVPVWQKQPVDLLDLPWPFIESTLTQIARSDDTRLTLAGRGDPMTHPQFSRALARAQDLGIHAIHVRSDFLSEDENSMRALAESEIDVVSCVIPSLLATTYARLMGVDQYARVLKRVGEFCAARPSGKLPIFVPVFVKLASNLDEMEPWYDQWLRAVQSAVIEGPTGCGGASPLAAADMAPARRGACRRLENRFTILADGSVVSCEEDTAARQPLGNVGQHSLAEIWRSAAAGFSELHRRGGWTSLPVCGPCTEWHRP